MADLDSVIVDFVVGDDIEIKRTITNVPSGTSITKAWLTIKAFAADPDANAIIQKIITTTDQPLVGQITDDGSGDQQAEVVFRVLGSETVLLTGGQTYRFDIQVKASTGRIYTPELGTITGRAQMTLADS
jgi:hypothetical protein